MTPLDYATLDYADILARGFCPLCIKYFVGKNPTSQKERARDLLRHCIGKVQVQHGHDALLQELRAAYAARWPK